MIEIMCTTITPVCPRPIRVFSTVDRALEHLCDHVLTRPESHFWFLFISGYGKVVPPEDDEALFHYARQLWTEPHDSYVQKLYDGYAGAIDRAIREATTCGLSWRERDESGGLRWRGLGGCGVYVIWDQGAVRSGMIVAFAARSPRRPVTPEGRKLNPLPRFRYLSHRPSPLDWGDPIDVVECSYQLFRRGWTRARRELDAAWRDGIVEEPANALREEVPCREEWRRLFTAMPPVESTGGETL